MADALKIKVCGMKDPENLEKVLDLRPDFVGYIFFRGSRRFVGTDPDPALFSLPQNRSIRVGVFVNEPQGSMEQHVSSGNLDLVQLHGQESPLYCKNLVNEGVHVIKALDPGMIAEPGKLQEYYGVVHYFLFDTPVSSHGGSGKKFNWELLKPYELPVPYFLSGGIGPGDEADIHRMQGMWLHGVDLNSRFESAPGVKDVSLLEAFMGKIRNGSENGVSSR
jgi:phosphoribosylanthranilate isomerase